MNNSSDTNKISVFKVYGSLSSQGFKHTIQEIKVTETDKCFVGKNIRISKKNIMVLDTIILNNHKLISFYTFCYKEDIQKALDMIKMHIIETFNIYKSEIDALAKFIEK